MDYFLFLQFYTINNFKSIEEQKLIRAIAEGDQEAFKKLYQLYAERVYNTVISYMQNVEDAEEVTQDVFTSIYKYAKNFKGNSKLSTWIYRISVNTSLNAIKKKAKRKNFHQLSDDLEKPDFNHPGILIEQKENAASLFRAIDELNDRQKTVFILSIIENLPRKEVANIMDMNLKAVESLLQRAKSSLRQKLEKMYNKQRK